ncbi:MAG: zinc-ribbon domain-containing protein [Clostridia bacterium]|nr:zinc-ribbon domain-containing protein [Clostridia bacterium]
MFCNKCGTLLEDDDRFCFACGNNTERVGKETDSESHKQFCSKKSRVWITILSVILSLSVVLNVIQIIFGNEKRFNNKVYDTEVSQRDYDNIVNEAIDMLTDHWCQFYETMKNDDGYLEIIHTRFVDITPDLNDTIFQKIDRAAEIDYIIEFTLHSDYFGAAPYYHNAALYDTVVVYNDGTSRVTSNLFRIYSSMTYSYDYSGFINEIVDLGTLYNRQMRLQ